MPASTPHRNSIQETFHTIIDAFKTGEAGSIAEYFAPEIKMETSNLGDAQGRAVVVRALTGAAPAGEFSRYYLTNEYIAVTAEKAQHSVYLTAAIIQNGQTSWFGCTVIKAGS